MIKALALVVLLAGWDWSQAGAKVLFYDPASGQPATPTDKPTSRLKPIQFAAAFPQYGYVGVHYWFENRDGAPLSENRAASANGPFTLHIRNNVGDAFLTVWAIQGDLGVQLTPMQGPYAGYSVGKEEYVVPGDFQFTHDEQAKRVLLVLSRSQTEQASSPMTARDRFEELTTRLARRSSGLVIIREVDDSTVGEIGTYVVNREGGPLAAEIVLRARFATDSSTANSPIARSSIAR